MSPSRIPHDNDPLPPAVASPRGPQGSAAPVGRWDGILRPYTAADVVTSVRARGTCRATPRSR